MPTDQASNRNSRPPNQLPGSDLEHRFGHRHQNHRGGQLRPPYQHFAPLTYPPPTQWQSYHCSRSQPVTAANPHINTLTPSPFVPPHNHPPPPPQWQSYYCSRSQPVTTANHHFNTLTPPPFVPPHNHPPVRPPPLPETTPAMKRKEATYQPSTIDSLRKDFPSQREAVVAMKAGYDHLDLLSMGQGNKEGNPVWRYQCRGTNGRLRVRQVGSTSAGMKFIIEESTKNPPPSNVNIGEISVAPPSGTNEGRTRKDPVLELAISKVIQRHTELHSGLPTPMAVLETLQRAPADYGLKPFDERLTNEGSREASLMRIRRCLRTMREKDEKHSGRKHKMFR